MHKKEKKRSLISQMRWQFLSAAFLGVAVAAIFSALVLFLHSRIPEETDANLNTKEFSKASELAAQIDNLEICRGQRMKILELKNIYENLPEKLKSQVGDKRYEKLSEAEELENILQTNDGGLFIKDKSPNGYDLDLAKTDFTRASLKRYGCQTAFEGQAAIDPNKDSDVFHHLFSRNNSFTIEAILNPNDSGYYNETWADDPDNYNMIASKGDHCMGLRISQQSLQFFIWNASQRWMNVKIDLTPEQLNTQIHAAGIYDGENIIVYLEGGGIRTLSGIESVESSNYPLTLGFCPETGRGSTAAIQSFRIYDRALTAAELDKKDRNPKDALLWYDFSDVESPWVSTEPSGIRSYTTDIQLKEQQELQLAIDPIPYYAQGDIVYETDRPQNVMVSETGLVTGVLDGTATITAFVKDSNFSIEIPVRVGKPPFSMESVLNHLVQRLFLIDLAIFLSVFLFAALWQRKQLLQGLEKVSGIIEQLGQTSGDLTLPPNLWELQALIHHADERFHQKELTIYETEKKKTELMAYLAHDLKTPIASTIGYLMLLRDETQLSEKTRRHYAEIALNNAQRLDELIEEFFEITRFHMSQIKLDYQEINLTWMLEQLISEFNPMFAEKNLSCNLDVPRDLHLKCDPDKLERVFDNLIRNAINYSYPYTTICISVQTGKQLTFLFENEGNKIPKEKLDRIFEQLYRLDSARSSDTGGSGLGLSIAKHIVELHNGTIFAESADNRICFTVRIPWKDL